MPSLAVCLTLGIPIAYSLGLSGYLYFIIHQPQLVSILPPRFLAGMDSSPMMALPLFILIGLLMNAGGISGSSVSDTASVGAVLIPEMKNKGYTLEFSSGITAASSTMGMIIPPSVPMIIYALVSDESVGKLFLGSLIPGIMIGVLMLSITLGISCRRKYPREEVLLKGKEKVKTVKQAIVALIMPVFVVGAVVFGIATPTESAGLGVLYAFLVGAFVIRDLKFSALPPLLRDAIMTSASVMVIIALSKLYIWILALERVPQSVAWFVSGLDIPAFLILLLIDLVILLTGTFVDVSPAILLLTPVFLPTMEVLGVSRVQFGVILISGLAVGLVTPPVGMCLNVASAISKLGIGKIFLGALPFLPANIVTLVLITFIPQLCLWLPSLFFN
jgi:tripartite ATP-independent transporter DctM subunit